MSGFRTVLSNHLSSVHYAEVAAPTTAHHVAQSRIRVDQRGLDFECRRIIHPMTVDNVCDLESS